MRRKPNSFNQDQNMVFPVTEISQYSRLMWMEHINFIKDMVARGLQHIFTVKHMILPDPFESDTLFTLNTNNKWIDGTFFGKFGELTIHSISFGVDNGIFGGGFYSQLMIKEYLVNVDMLYMIFKKRSVKKSNHMDKSLNKNAINEITLLYKYYHKKLRLFKKAHKRFKTLDTKICYAICHFLV